MVDESFQLNVVRDDTEARCPPAAERSEGSRPRALATRPHGAAEGVREILDQQP